MKTVLIVENHADLLEMLSDNVENAGYLAVKAFNGAEAEKALAEKDLDLVLMEIVLPDMDGLSFIKQMKANHATRDLPVIALSARTGAKIEALAAGADEFIAMPAFPLDIIEVVQAMTG